MQPSSRLSFGLALWTFMACGAPAELDVDRFPARDMTGYTDGASGAGAVVNNGGATGVIPQGGSSNPGTGGSVQVTQGGSGPGTGGSGNPPANGGSGQQLGGDGGAAGDSQTIPPPPPPDGCPEDITVLFARNISEGGCTNGGGCHESGGPIAPDLVSPNVAARLLNVASSCSSLSNGMSVGPRPYIGAEDSYLAEKIAGTPASTCGFSMPLLQPQNLSAADEQCILDWIDEVAAGGG